jgi:hypothetical protein
MFWLVAGGPEDCEYSDSLCWSGAGAVVFTCSLYYKARQSQSPWSRNCSCLLLLLRTGSTIHSRHRRRMGSTGPGRILLRLPRMGFRRTAGSFATWRVFGDRVGACVSDGRGACRQTRKRRKDALTVRGAAGSIHRRRLAM